MIINLYIIYWDWNLFDRAPCNSSRRAREGADLDNQTYQGTTNHQMVLREKLNDATGEGVAFIYK